MKFVSRKEIIREKILDGCGISVGILTAFLILLLVNNIEATVYAQANDSLIMQIGDTNPGSPPLCLASITAKSVTGPFPGVVNSFFVARVAGIGMNVLPVSSNFLQLIYPASPDALNIYFFELDFKSSSTGAAQVIVRDPGKIAVTTLLTVTYAWNDGNYHVYNLSLSSALAVNLLVDGVSQGSGTSSTSAQAAYVANQVVGINALTGITQSSYLGIDYTEYKNGYVTDIQDMQSQTGWSTQVGDAGCFIFIGLPSATAIQNATVYPFTIGTVATPTLDAAATITGQTKTQLQTDSIAISGVPTAAGNQATTKNNITLYSGTAPTTGGYAINVSAWVKYVATPTNGATSANVAVALYAETKGLTISGTNVATLLTSYVLNIANKSTNTHISYSPLISLNAGVTVAVTIQSDQSGVYIYKGAAISTQLNGIQPSGGLAVNIHWVTAPTGITLFSTRIGELFLGVTGTFQKPSVSTVTQTFVATSTSTNTVTVAGTFTATSTSTTKVITITTTTNVVNQALPSQGNLWFVPLLFMFTMMGGVASFGTLMDASGDFTIVFAAFGLSIGSTFATLASLLPLGFTIGDWIAFFFFVLVMATGRTEQ